MELFRVKVCGVTTPDDAVQVAQAGADAIGLNFYPRSSRFVVPTQAAEIVAHLPPGVQRVGLFVNASLPQINRVLRRVDLDWVQFHGDEPPELVYAMRNIRVIRAFRVTGYNLGPMLRYLAHCDVLRRRPDAVLLDAASPGAYGGTGTTLPWAKMAKYLARWSGPSWILAGGLTPENVGQAIRQSGAQHIDVASGVEHAPGSKDARLVAQLVAQARQAWESTAGGPDQS